MAISVETLPLERCHQARVVALSVAHCSAMASLLRASRQDEHASNVEAAITVTLSLVANQVGRETMAEAIDWARNELDVEIELPDLRALAN